VFDVELLSNYYTKQSRVPKLPLTVTYKRYATVLLTLLKKGAGNEISAHIG
jgi:hypothetical protein